MKTYNSNNTLLAKPHNSFVKILVRCTSYLLILSVIALALYGYFSGWFSSVTEIKTYITSFGSISVIVFIMAQLLQVVLPIIPNPVLSIAGVIIFGPVWGFVFNLAGIFIGSMLSFWLSKRFGRIVITSIFPQKIIDKYDNWTSRETTSLRLFTVAMLLPFMPHDFLSYLAGTTKITWRQFAIMTIIGRAIAVSIYSIFFDIVSVGIVDTMSTYIS